MRNDFEISSETSVRFPIPTDEEISVMLGGTPVISYKPEDFPYFQPSIYDCYSLRTLSERCAEIHQRWMSFCPADDEYSFASNCIEQHALNRSAQLTTIRLKGSKKPTFFALLRPSDKIDPSLAHANACEMPASSIQSDIPREDLNFISTYHEIGHMHAAVNGIEFENDYEDEFYAETFAYTKYLEAGGSIDVIRKCIEQRALEGFLRQPPKYWLAQNLSARFLNTQQEHMGLKAAVDMQFELWIRIKDILYPGKLKSFQARALKNISSDEICHALDLIRENQADDIENDALWFHSYKITNKKNNPFSDRDDKVVLFAALEEVVRCPNIDPAVKAHGEQILKAGRQSWIGLGPALDEYMTALPHIFPPARQQESFSAAPD